MTWACFSFYEKPQIVFTDGRQTPATYVETLKDNLLLWAAKTHGETWKFQQDNCPIHTANKTNAFFRDKNITVIPWPSRAPDLNPLENLWSIVARAVYKDAREFVGKDDLKVAIIEAWNTGGGSPYAH